MKKYDIGVDPDSRGNGIAVYEDGKLIILKNLSAAALAMFLAPLVEVPENRVRIHIEDVCATSAVFKGRFNKGEKLESKLMKAQNVGMCKQAQIEIEAMAKMLNIQVFKYDISNRWKSQQEKALFARATNWTGKSNEDTRSAAFFGFLGVRRGELATKRKAERENSVKTYK